MKYTDLKETFCELNRNTPTENLTAHIVFAEDSYNKPYPLLSRSYIFTSDNKAFYPKMGGYSIFAYCLDGSDQGVHTLFNRRRRTWNRCYQSSLD